MARQKIIDEFTDLPFSPQKQHYLRLKRDGKCINCGKPEQHKAFMCLQCHGIHNQKARARMWGNRPPERKPRVPASLSNVMEKRN